MKGSSAKVTGMREFRKDIKKLAPVSGFDSGISTKGAGELLKGVNDKVANHILQKSIIRAGGLGRMQLSAARSMKVKSTMSAAQLVMGNNPKVPYFFGAEFGAYSNMSRFTTGRGGKSVSYLGWGQFKDWKKPGSGNTGYFLFPTMRAETEEIKEIWGREFDRISSEVFPNGR